MIHHIIKSVYGFFSLKILVLSLLGFSSFTGVHAQTVIQGSVIDEDREVPVVGATVFLKGTTTGVVSDLNGEFSIRAAGLPATLVIEYVGYRSEEIVVYDTSEPLVIAVRENSNLLDEVVVTGYTTQQRKAISAAISSISFDEALTSQADNNFTQLLQGKVTGVQIVSTSGLPGGGVTFLIRGNNSIDGSLDPLYVVDGVFLNTSVPIGSSGGNLQSSPLADINPNDIESISILKDANATAIYGSQGSNGVVVITTKRGKLNAKSRINVLASHGWANAVNHFKAITGPETGLLLNESWTNTASDNGETLATYLTRVKPTNWDLVYPYKQADGTTPDFTRNAIDDLPTYDRISSLYHTAQLSDYQVSVQGGNATSNHYVGVGYSEESSIIKPTVFQRFSGRINYDNKVTEKLKLGTSFNLNRTQRTKVRGSDNDPGGVINSAIFPRSFLPIYDANGNYVNQATFNNHLRYIEHLDNRYVTWRNTVNLYGEYAFLPELKLRSSWSFDYVNNTSKSFNDFSMSTNGSASAGSTLSLVYTAEQLLTYIKSFGEDKQHDVNVLLGNTINVRKSESLSASGSGYTFEQLREVSSAATTSGSASSSENRLVSFFGKAGYSYAGKYTFDFSLRADGSSRFGENVRWGYFPAFGVTWNAGQEAFVRNLNLFDALRLRGSFGYSGNQNGIGNYASLSTWSSSSSGYLDQPSLAPGNLGNPDLTWELSRQTDLGVEFGVLNNRLSVNFDVYWKYTYNMLLGVEVPSRTGYSSYTQNYGELSNRGVELSLESVNFRTRNFTWRTAFNISANRNRIEKIPQEQTMGASSRGTSILREGEPVNSFFIYKQLYVDPQTGNAVYEDVDKDGEITYADRQIVGKAPPDYTGGITNVVNYKNFELNVFFYFTKGNDIMNMHDFFLVHGGTMGGIGFIPRQLERWQKPGDVTDIPRLTVAPANPTQNGGHANNYVGQVNNLSSRYLDDGSYLRLKNLSLSYTVPKNLSAKLRIERIKATVSATNLWTLTNYKGLDPEVSAQSSSNNTAGYDWATIPQPRTFQVILNITL
ncbi:MAG: TonB-dependent receptor [Bacteroidales bacterium]|jgi:TonB-linked SusC/RagA family outer membrane protein|nr:TonB-dependent receptor [Bacteroidales bacterium]